MLVPIIIDSRDILSQFYVSPTELENMYDNIAKAITLQYYYKLENEVSNTLKSTKMMYLQNLRLIDSGRMEGTVMLDYSKNKLIQKLEEGSSPYDMKCIVNPRTKIYTSKGQVNIKDIKVGDLVLTHKGKFKKVAHTFKEPNTDKFVYKLNVNFKNWGVGLTTLWLTGNHPILTKRGWIRVGELQVDDKLIVTAEKCSYKDCNNQIPYIYTEHGCIEHCSKSCAGKTRNKDRVGKKRTDLSEETLQKMSLSQTESNRDRARKGIHPAQPGGKLHAIMKERSENGTHTFQTFSEEELKRNRHSAAVSQGKRHFNSDPESVFWEKLQHIPGFERQVLFKRDKFKKHKSGVNINSWFFLDFGNVKEKICIEINGEHFHTEEEDLLRRQELESKGWTYFSFWSKEVYKDLDRCIDEVKRVLKNHKGEYKFIDVPFTLEKIEFNDRCRQGYLCWKYNLTVEDDSSYIANGIVTHNSGLLASPKAKIGKGGKRFITVPMRWSTPGAIGESELFSSPMPVEIHKIAKRTSGPLSISQIPQQYQTLEVRPVINDNSGKKLFDEYQHKNSIYEGIFKKTDSVTAQSMYMSFRRISENSDANAFIHPGFKQGNFMQKTLDQFDLETVLQQQIDIELSKLGF